MELTPFDGKPVYSATVAIRNAGDGLSEAMEVDPIELHHGDLVHVVIECEVDKLRFDPIRDTDGLQRVHMLKAGRATMIDAAAVREALDAQTTRIEEATGVQQLPFDDDDEDGDGPIEGQWETAPGHDQPYRDDPDVGAEDVLDQLEDEDA